MPGSWLATLVAGTKPISSILGILGSSTAFSLRNSLVNSTAQSYRIPPRNRPSSITGYVDPEDPVGAKGDISVNLRRENVVCLIGGASRGKGGRRGVNVSLRRENVVCLIGGASRAKGRHQIDIDGQCQLAKRKCGMSIRRRLSGQKEVSMSICEERMWFV